MPVMLIYSLHFYGALAQLGERMAGSHEVRGSIPLCSTKLSKADPFGSAFFFLDFVRRGSVFLMRKTQISPPCCAVAPPAPYSSMGTQLPSMSHTHASASVKEKNVSVGSSGPS